MPSLQSRVIRLLVKYRHFLNFQLKRNQVGDTSLQQLRQEAENNYKILKMPSQISVSQVTTDYFTGEWLLPPDGNRDSIILYLHGGGYVMGSSKAYRKVVARFVEGSGVAALSVDYRLAPENPFPAAVEDSISAYKWLLGEGTSPADIVIAGDSAGGGLALATLIALRDEGVTLPAAAVTISPWTDLKATGESYRTRLKVDPVQTPGSWNVFSNYYTGGQDPSLPLVSPLYGELFDLPPLLIYVGSDEVMLDDSTSFAEKARKAGVEVDIKVWEGMFHCFPNLTPLFPEARQAMDEICSFINANINK